MSSRELKELKNELDAKCGVLLKQQLALLGEHFKQYPWGITAGEFTAYLLDCKSKIDERSINDDVGQFPGLKQKYQIALINGLRRKISQKVASKEYFETPQWNDFISAFLSPSFLRAKCKCTIHGLVCGHIFEETTFFATTPVQLWARLFLEAEENLKVLNEIKPKPFSLTGYRVLKLVQSRMLDARTKLFKFATGGSVGHWENKLSGLSGLGLITITDDQYALTDTTINAFAQVKNCMSTDKDIRRWPYRYDILFPPKNIFRPPAKV